MTRHVLLLAVFTPALGCGPTRPAAEIERSRRAVVAALDAWKANEPPARLKALADPVDFTEELRSGYALADYTVGAVDAADPAVIRFAVALKLKDRKGKSTDREVVYAVALKNPAVVSATLITENRP